MSIKVRFTFIAEASVSDPKTTVICLRYMQFDDDEHETVYAFPEHRVHLQHHDKLMQLPSAKTAKKSLVKRGTRRTVKITLPQDVAILYVDEDGNPVFDNEMLGEYVESPRSVSSTTLSQIGDATNTTVEIKSKPLATILKDAVISKYGQKSIHAESWLQMFESECVRLGVAEDRYWEAIRLFLEKSAEEWYETTRLTTTSTSWEYWRNSFLDNFGQKGWSSARAAFSYHYISGSLSDYAQTKMNLLVRFNPKMDDFTLRAQIVCGLPLYLQERIDMAETPNVGKLISKINSFNCPTPRNFANQLKQTSSAFSSLKRVPCGYCKKKGFERFHAEKDCFTKIRDSQNRTNFNIENKQGERKAINNIEINELANEIIQESKNE